MIDWSLAKAVGRGVYQVHGGYQHNSFKQNDWKGLPCKE